MELPLDATVTLEDMRVLHHTLVNSGGSIDEINSVRKHLSAVKGGRLAKAAPEATKVTLAITDVPAGRESGAGFGADTAGSLDRRRRVPRGRAVRIARETTDLGPGSIREPGAG